MVELIHGAYGVTIAEDREYTYGSADNVNTYRLEYVLNDMWRADWHSRCAIRVADNFGEVASCILLASGYWTDILEHSVILHDDSCIVVVGPCVASVSLPNLRLQWSTIVDEFKCKEILAAANGRNIITRGSNRIACLTYMGEMVWELKGGYQFSNNFQIRSNHLEIIGWDDVPRLFDISTGQEISR
ncbi:hypothetical protein CA54_50880 [Symmachiella macrocystis]|uniref:Uncharacterized protein n=1 Tax=Symmachiella macrocystis TaxID=2527985 RepID=A0A5C6B5V9_9PLAN|nr:hypothetical protein [Symmachiella macrocystis]TWU06689.1 hypothetical protein CA54_50880 [Symmachiella macrocystis]